MLKFVRWDVLPVEIGLNINGPSKNNAPELAGEIQNWSFLQEIPTP